MARKWYSKGVRLSPEMPVYKKGECTISRDEEELPNVVVVGFNCYQARSFNSEYVEGN